MTKSPGSSTRTPTRIDGGSKADQNAIRVTPYVGLLLIAYVLLNVPLFGTKPETFDQVKVFSVDEHKICIGIASLLRAGSFIDPGDVKVTESGCNPYPYGQLYPLLVAAPLMAVEPMMAVDERVIVRWAVVVLVISGLVVLLMTYATAARLYSPWYGLLAATLVLITPEFLRWGNEIHPDLPQLACLMTGFYFTVRLYEVAAVDAWRRRMYTALAAACAGLAMAAKFNGFFLLPAIFVAYNRGVISARGFRWREVVGHNTVYGLACLAVFVGATLACSPCYVANPDLAWEPFTRSARNSMITVQAALTLWERLQALVHSNRVMAELVVGYGVYVLFFAAVAHALWQLWYRRDEELRSPRILAEVYAVPFLTYSLVLGYGLTDGRLLAGYERYLLPALPMIYISVLRIVALAAQSSLPYRTPALAAVAILLIAGQAPLILSFVEQYRAFHLRKEMGFFQVHDWVLENVPKGTTIFTEAYIYVPFDQYRVTRHYAVDSVQQMASNEYVITKTLDYEVYKKPDRWHLYSKVDSMVRSREIYERLERGEFPGFERVALLSAGDAFEGNDAVAVYKNLDPKPASQRPLGIHVPAGARDQISGGLYAEQIPAGPRKTPSPTAPPR